MGLAPLDVFAQASKLGAGTKGWSLSESDLVVGSVAVLAITLGGWVWTRKFGAPAHDSEIINPFAAGGFGEHAVPVVRLLHRLQGQPVPSTNGAAVTAAPVGWVFRVLNFVDNWLYWCTSLRLVPVRRAEIQALADSLARAGEGDSTPKAVHLFLNELTREPISATGRLAVQQWITGILHVRRHVQNYVERHPEIHDVPIEAPMFIIGPPRTASSFILRLLSQDTAFRTPKFWEINFPTPPPEEATYATDERIRMAERGLDSFNAIQEGFIDTIRKFHYIGADEVEEDSLLLTYSMCFGMYFHLSPDAVSPFCQWMFDDKDKDSAYRLHKQFIQILSLRFRPKTCWLLKAPIHSLYPEVLLRTYPDARIIVTHRDHLSAISSWTKFVLAHTGPMAGDSGWQPYTTAKQTTVLVETMLNRIAKARKKADAVRKAGDKSQFFDIEYQSLCANPMKTVEAVYDHFDMSLSDEARRNMQRWIANNPQNTGMYGKTKHDIAWTGMSEETLRKRCDDAGSPEHHYPDIWR